MGEWQPKRGPEWHAAALSGKPLLVFGTPRFGHPSSRPAIAYFETGHGWKEANNDRPFDVTHWMPLPEAPHAS